MFRDKIQAKYEDLSPRFRTLADFVLENTLDVGFLTATDLARRVDVDPATVVRFSQELGYSGYRELSREIKQYINQQLALRYQKGAANAEGLTQKVALMTDELSDRVLTMKADANQIAEVARKMHNAQRVYITSTPEGQGIADLWSTYLNIVGMKTQAIKSDPAQAALLLRDITSEDLLIVISMGLGPEADLGHFLVAAQERGVTTISITTSPTLLPARQADLNLVAAAKTPSNYPSFDTLMALLSLLWQTIIMLDEEKADAGVEATITALKSLVTQRDKLPPYDINALLRLWEQK